MERTNISDIRRRFEKTNDKDTLNRLVHETQIEAGAAIEILRNLDSKAARDALYDEMYELKQLRNAIRNRLTHVVKRELAERHNG